MNRRSIVCRSGSLPDPPEVSPKSKTAVLLSCTTPMTSAGTRVLQKEHRSRESDRLLEELVIRSGLGHEQNGSYCHDAEKVYWRTTCSATALMAASKASFSAST
jgi:hypothetical protein